MADDVRELFAEYADAYARGERPQAVGFLARAGDGADELARMLETFLAAAPRPAPDAGTVAFVAAWAEGEPPLVHLRASRGVRVDEVVDAIVVGAGVAREMRPKVKQYYQRLEQGLLDPAGVSDRVWDAIRRLIGPVADAAVGWRPQTATLEPAFYRASPRTAAFAVQADRQAEPAPERDEVDELFTKI